MLFSKPLPFIAEFIEQLDQGIFELAPGRKLSKLQKFWLSFCLTGILLSSKICWAEFHRLGLAGYKLSALSWMFRHSKIAWSLLLHASIKLILKRYGITQGVLVGDDSDKQRTKITQHIFAAYKVFDQKTGGYFNGQTIVLLLLVTSKVSIPVGFCFYQPDPAVKEFRQNDEKLKKQGVKKSERPAKPEPNPAYPTKLELLLALLKEFKQHHKTIKIKAILVDAFYGSAWFMDQVAATLGGTQTISQLEKNQKIIFRNKEISITQYFTSYPGIEITLKIRGIVQVKVTLGSARLYVKAHEKKRFVVALKYEGEEDYRYLVASEMSWRAIDIAAAYTYRWLIEVFFEDWKLHEGWGNFAPQFDQEGSSRGLILSLLLDYALLLHPEQTARVENNLPACTVGSLQQKSQMDAFVDVVRGIVDAPNPHEKLDEIVQVIKRVFPLRDSTKHMSGRNLGRLEPSPALKYRAKECAA